MASQIREEISTKIVESLKNGNPPWRSSTNRGLPENPKTGRKYTGINPLLLDAVADKEKYRSKYWATFKQWHSLDINVAKKPENHQGDWGIGIINWKAFLKTTDTGSTLRMDRFHLMQKHFVFNADQCFGVDCGKYMILNENIKTPDYSKAENVIKATKANISHHGKVKNPRYVRPPHDKILLPSKKKFLNDAQYYAAKFHELFHWAEWRLGWSGTEDHGELIAEIATGYLESELDLPHDTDMTNHDQWLPTWIDNIEKNPKYLFDSAAQASRVVDYILGFTRIQEKEDALDD